MATTKRALTDTAVQGRHDMLSAEQVAAWLGVPKTFIYRRTCRGHSDPIPSYRFGGHLRFRADEIQEWIDSHRNRATDDLADAVTTLYLEDARGGRSKM